MKTNEAILGFSIFLALFLFFASLVITTYTLDAFIPCTIFSAGAIAFLIATVKMLNLANE